MIVSIGIPRPVDLERAGGLATIGIAQVREDATVLSLELLDGIERAGDQAGHPRVQSPAGDQQQRKPGTGLLIPDANGALFVVVRISASLPSLLSKHARRRGHRRYRGSSYQYVASGRIHNPAPSLGEDCNTAGFGAEGPRS